MKRKKLTQVFPFLLPIRKWQRKKLFYLEMLIDGNKYAKNKSEALLPNTVFETSSLMLNENSGFDMKYQINKVHNLKLAARTINKVIIEPNETPCGTDATINEGWLDLKIRNDTDNTFQIEISFDDKYMYGRILSQNPVNIEYSVFNSSVSYIKRNGRTYQIAPVYRSERDKKTCRETGAELYINQCEIGYELPNDTKIEERGA